MKRHGPALLLGAFLAIFCPGRNFRIYLDGDASLLVLGSAEHPEASPPQMQSNGLRVQSKDIS